MSGWTRLEIAIAVPVPPPIVWAEATSATGTVGARRYWAEWDRANRLLLLRASVPVRTTSTPQSRKEVVSAAFDWWRRRLKFVTLNPVATAHLMWSWAPDEHTGDDAA